MTQKHIHFIGICGVAMSALAIAFHKRGYKVTGSDKGFYPPVSTHLKDAGVSYYPGWHIDKMTANGDPDIVIVGNVAASTNPEWQYVQENKLKYLSYPEAIAEFWVKEHSIVCAGTYGKSTSTALLTWILKTADMSPSYMFGGISKNDMEAAEITDTEWSVLEGDEYKSARWDTRAKFAHYSPTHLLLTAVVWDHADVYPTENDYKQAFADLVKNVPQNGLLVISDQVKSQKEVIQHASARTITYGKDVHADYRYTNVETSPNGISFEIQHKEITYYLYSPLLGDYMAENITGCFALAHELGIPGETITSAIQSFQNIKRRLEKRFDGGPFIFDDIAHSPTKATAILETLRAVYSGDIYAVFEPNTGNRKTAAIPAYANAFADATTVLIPRLTTVKTDKNDIDPPFDGEKLTEVISETHSAVRYMPDDQELVQFLARAKKDDCIVFLGSHGFRGMIEELLTQFST